MYSSLTRVDLLVDDAGRRVAVQTDHRSAAEVDATWEVSAVFAAARATNPVLAGIAAAVRFSHSNPPPARYVRLVTQLGAEVEADGVVHAAAPDLATADDVVEAALLTLGAQVYDEHHVAVDLDGLRRVEAALRRTTNPADETVRWTDTARLAGAVCLLLQRTRGGHLHRETAPGGALPYRWEVDGRLLDALGRPAAFLGDDPSVLPSRLFTVLDDDGPGRPLWVLRRADWGGRALATWRPLVGGDEGAALPIAVLVEDRPDTTRTIPPDAADLPRLSAEAETNLRAVPVTQTESGPALLVHGDDYAAEKLLDPDLLRDAAARLDAPLLVAAVPRRGLLVLRSALAEPDELAVFQRGVDTLHHEAAPQDRLSTALLLVSDGVVVGVARPLA